MNCWKRPRCAAAVRSQYRQSKAAPAEPSPHPAQLNWKLAVLYGNGAPCKMKLRTGRSCSRSEYRTLGLVPAACPPPPVLRLSPNPVRKPVEDKAWANLAAQFYSDPIFLIERIVAEGLLPALFDVLAVIEIADRVPVVREARNIAVAGAGVAMLQLVAGSDRP
jgi:hypothetical protein